MQLQRLSIPTPHAIIAACLAYLHCQHGRCFPHGQTEEPWHNRLLGKHDVCLMNVDAIYQLSSSNKRKLLAPRSNVAGRVKELQIRCKVRSGRARAVERTS